MRQLAPVLALCCAIASAQRANATILDSNFSETTFVNASLPGVTGMAWAPDGSQRLFLSVKPGPVRIIENGVLLPTPFATISPAYHASECGVIGLAFDPNFANNGYVYFFVTVSTSEQQIIRYTANGNVGTNKTAIVTGLPTVGQNHDGGAIGFGPDGKLYWGIGDNGTGRGVDQDLTLLAAKIGRANADGSVPTDNPFVDGNGPNADLIWARGFRNPFTFTFQPSTERLWVNTVGTYYEQVFVPRRGEHAGYDDYENNQPAGYITPVIAYRSNTWDVRTIAASGASRSRGVATFRTTVNHLFRVGGKITIDAVSDPSFNGSAYVSAVSSATEFSIAQSGPDATSGAGTASTQSIGGAITGGAFWESTAIPAAYRGNYFFGDYNSGRIERVTLDANNVVTSVDHWAEGYTYPIDIEVGPDGNLYYAEHGGLVRRAAPVTTTQSLVVSRRYLRMAEGGTLNFHVRLATPPATTVNVSVSRTSGDTGVNVSQGGSLSFSATDWSIPKAVTIAAVRDADSVESSATFAATTAGLTPAVVVVRVTDDNPVLPPADAGIDGTAGSDGSIDAAGGNAGTAGSGGTDSGSEDAGGLSDGAIGSAGLGAAGGGGSATAGNSANPDASAGSGAGGVDDDSGCGCRMPGRNTVSTVGPLTLLLLLAGRRRARQH